MRRRRFLRTAGAGALGAGLMPRGSWGVVGGPGSSGPGPGMATGPSTATVSEPSTPIRPQADFTAWTWVHGGKERTPREWRERFALMRSSGIRGVLVSGGDTGVLAEAAHAEDLEFHRWMWILNRNGDEQAKAEHPEWFTVSRNGASSLEEPPYVGYYRWVCPTREPVREHIRGLIDQVAEDPRVDGIHLDYIRHCDVILPVGLWSTYDLVQDQEYAEFDFCYCDVCRPTFQALHGVDPMTLDDAPGHEAWRRFRWDSVTRLVTELAETVHARGKPISAAVFPTPAIARRLVRQAWDEWPVDVVYPMLYHSFYEEDVPWIGGGVREGVSALEGSGTALRGGLYLPSLEPEELAEAVRVVREGGAAGVSLFEMDGLSEQHVAVIRDELA